MPFTLHAFTLHGLTPVNDPITAKHGHTTLPKDSADMAQWIIQHAGEHGFTLDEIGRAHV